MAAALGMVAVRHGRRTIVAEVAARDDVSRALRGDDEHDAHVFVERELQHGLHHISIDPQGAMEEYLHDQLPGRALAELLSSSRMFGLLAAATPGMRELLSIGKVWELAQPTRRTSGAEAYDLVILDAPATGHGVALLEAPRTFSEAARVGPIARQGRTINAMLSNPQRTGVVAVARGEEMPVSETLSLRAALRDRMGLDLDLAVVNAVVPDRFSAADARALRSAAAGGAAPALGIALSAHANARAQRNQVARLRRGLGMPAACLPFLFEPELGSGALDRLSRELERVL